MPKATMTRTTARKGDPAKERAWADFAALDPRDQARRVVREAKQRLKKLGCGHLSVHRGRGTAYGRLSVNRKDHNSFTPKEMLAIAEVFDEDARARTNCVSMWFIEAEMKLGLRRKEPLCSWCGCTYDTEREATNCHLSH